MKAPDFQGRFPVDGVDVGDAEDAALGSDIELFGRHGRLGVGRLHAGVATTRHGGLLGAADARGAGAGQARTVAAFHDDEHHTVQDEHCRNGNLVVKMRVHPVVE